MTKKIDSLIFLNLALLIAALLFLNYSDFDVNIQNQLFNQETKSWAIDAEEPVKKFIFYSLPKILFGIAIAAALGATIISFKKTRQNRYRLLLILLGLIIIPLTVGNVKKFTNIYCPNQLNLYSGQYPHLHIFEKPDANFEQLQRTISPHGEPLRGRQYQGRCFPAGHAVTGFALMILFFALEKKSHKFIGLFAAIVLGWVLGFYQMAKGVHFFGHNLISMLACFLAAALIAKMAQTIWPHGFKD